MRGHECGEDRPAEGGIRCRHYRGGVPEGEGRSGDPGYVPSLITKFVTLIPDKGKT